MIFIDEAEVFVRGGRGGDGCVSFRRERAVPKGGPDGGDGGDGGSVIIEANANVNTLVDLVNRMHWHAKPGRAGMGANCAGRGGEDLMIHVPPGTMIQDRDRGVVLKDLVKAGQRVCAARGGRGGRGNTRFKSATHQAPREFEEGEAGEERWLHLELKLIAEVGIVGMPNAGKSTLLSHVSRAKPKIASYPFTTLVPQLGIVELPGFRRFVIAEIPGLIEGAHDGAGLGDQFLRHVERTRILVHLVDLMPGPGLPRPMEAYRLIREELEKYSSELTAKPELVVGNKLDLSPNGEALKEFRRQLGRECLGVSAVTGHGLAELCNRLWKELAAIRATADEIEADV